MDLFDSMLGGVGRDFIVPWSFAHNWLLACSFDSIWEKSREISVSLLQQSFRYHSIIYWIRVQCVINRPRNCCWRNTRMCAGHEVEQKRRKKRGRISVSYNIDNRIELASSLPLTFSRLLKILGKTFPQRHSIIMHIQMNNGKITFSINWTRISIVIKWTLLPAFMSSCN